MIAYLRGVGCVLQAENHYNYLISLSRKDNFNQGSRLVKAQGTISVKIRISISQQ